MVKNPQGITPTKTPDAHGGPTVKAGTLGTGLGRNRHLTAGRRVAVGVREMVMGASRRQGLQISSHACDHQLVNLPTGVKKYQ